MSAKTSTAQPPGRRTPLSLNTSTKQTHKPTNNKNDNNKKDTNSYNQQKTDSKKDSQQEKKNFVEKKNSSSDTRKLSSDSKKVDEVKTATVVNEESKKSQNGVSTNGVKDKDKANTNEGTKPRPETASAVSTPKKESQKAANEGAKSKADTTSVGTISKKESQKAAAEKKDDSTPAVVVKETKKEDNKNKEKETAVEGGVQKSDEKNKEKERKEDVEKKQSDETASDAKKTEITKTPEKLGKETKDANNWDSSESRKEPSLTEQKVDEEKVTATVESKIEETPKIEKMPDSEQTEDIDMMEPLTYEDEISPQIMAASTPAKLQRSDDFLRRSDAKTSPKLEAKLSSASIVHTPDRKSYSKNFSSISGRRTIRPIGDYSFSGNLQIRESYRKINTELDFTSSSLNVTVGSEVPNNDSFSFFARSRKRDRSSPSRHHLSAMEVQGDISPKSPKRARIDIGMAGFFSAMASPISMLRSRLARTTVQSTPKKQLETPVDDVENVSGISVNTEITATEDLTMNPDSTVDNAAIENDQQNHEEPIVCSEKPAAEDVKQEDDLKFQDIVVTAVDTQTKKKCSIM